MFKRFLAAAMLLALPFVASAANFVEGTDYTVISNPGNVDKPGMVEVREFFWYGCPHCFRLDPFIEKWLSTKPAYVNFVRTPAALNDTWEINARGFYVAQMLGKEDATHVALFNAIHQGHEQLFDPDSLSRFYANYGIDPATFTADYNSFDVMGKIGKSKSLAQQYGIDGVPSLIVDGKYIVKGETSKVLDIVNFLIAKEYAGMPHTAPAAPAAAPATHKKHKAAAATPS